MDGEQVGLDSWTLRLGFKRRPRQILNYLYESQYGNADMAIQNLAPAFWSAEYASSGDWPAELTVLGPRTAAEAWPDGAEERTGPVGADADD